MLVQPIFACYKRTLSILDAWITKSVSILQIYHVQLATLYAWSDVGWQVLNVTKLWSTLSSIIWLKISLPVQLFLRTCTTTHGYVLLTRRAQGQETIATYVYNRQCSLNNIFRHLLLFGVTGDEGEPVRVEFAQSWICWKKRFKGRIPLLETNFIFNYFIISTFPNRVFSFFNLARKYKI